MTRRPIRDFFVAYAIVGFLLAFVPVEAWLPSPVTPAPLVGHFAVNGHAHAAAYFDAMVLLIPMFLAAWWVLGDLPRAPTPPGAGAVRVVLIVLVMVGMAGFFLSLDPFDDTVHRNVTWLQLALVNRACLGIVGMAYMQIVFLMAATGLVLVPAWLRKPPSPAG